MKTARVSILKCLLGLAILLPGISTVQAGQLAERIAKGESIRLGFANEVPWSYTGPNNEALGFVNAYAIGVLKKMGYKNIEAVVTDWDGLVPGLQANRVDLVTGGIYILGSRCGSMTFSEPMAKVSDGFIVKTGNPSNIHTYKDFVKTGTTMVTGTGYSNIEAARKEGVPDEHIMQVPGSTEILAAVTSGWASAGAVDAIIARDLANKSNGQVEATDPNDLPEWTQAYVGIAFRNADADFVKQFNEAQKEYLGSPAMLEAVKPYGYDQKILPGDKTTAWVCANR